MTNTRHRRVRRRTERHSVRGARAMGPGERRIHGDTLRGRNLERGDTFQEEAMITGQVEFYDDSSAWGLIRGEDGILYDLRGGQMAGPAPRVGDRVTFDPQDVPGAPRAGNVKRITPPTVPPPPIAPASPPPRPGATTRPPRAIDSRHAHPPAGR